LEGEQKRREEVERKKGEQQDTSSKAEQLRGTWVIIAMALSLAKEAGVASTAGSNRTCSNRRCGEN